MNGINIGPFKGNTYNPAAGINGGKGKSPGSTPFEVEREGWYKTQGENLIKQPYWQSKSIKYLEGRQPDAKALLTELGDNGKTYGKIQVTAGYGSLIQYKIPGKTFNGGIFVMVNLEYDPSSKKITGISSNIPADTLAVNLELYGSKDLPMLKEIREYLGLPKATDEMKNDEGSAVNMRDAKQKELANITSEEGRWVMENGKLERTAEVRESMSDLAGTNEVGQGQFGICKYGDSRSQYLQTFGAAPCVIVTLYDPSTKTGLIAHVDATKDMKSSMAKIMNQLEQAGVDPQKLQARVIGGNTGQSEETIIGIYNVLSDNNIPIIEKDILGQGSRAIILDTQTGNVYDYSESIHDTSDNELSMIVLQTQLSRVLNFNRNKNGYLPAKSM